MMLRSAVGDSSRAQAAVISRSRASPREALDFTVPTEQPSTAAASASRAAPSSAAPAPPAAAAAAAPAPAPARGAARTRRCRPGGRAARPSRRPRAAAAAAATVHGQVVHGPAQVALGVAVDPAPGPHHPLQGRLEQVLSACRPARRAVSPWPAGPAPRSATRSPARRTRLRHAHRLSFRRPPRTTRHGRRLTTKLRPCRGTRHGRSFESTA